MRETCETGGKSATRSLEFRVRSSENSELRTSDPARLPLLARFKLRTQHAELRTGFIPGEYHDCPPESSLLGVCPSHPSLRGVRNSSLVNCERDKLDVRDRHDPKFEVPKTSNLEPRTFARPAFLACRASPARITRYDSRFTLHEGRERRRCLRIVCRSRMVLPGQTPKMLPRINLADLDRPRLFDYGF